MRTDRNLCCEHCRHPARRPVRAPAFIVAILAIVMLLAAGCSQGLNVPKGYSLTPQMKKLLAQYPPPGRMVDIGGYSLHIYGQGNGGPTVVMEAGSGSPSLVWSLVAPEVAKKTRVVVYDRAGLGWSNPSPKPRTANNMISELHTLLGKAGIMPPYVLVGHSMGAVYMRMFAHLHPAEVVGMVLVDPGDENLPVAAGPAVAKNIEIASQEAAAYNKQQAAKCATGAFARDLTKVPLDTQLPEQSAKQLQALEASEPWMWSAISAEGLGAFDSWAQARAMNITSLGDIPLTVIVSDTLVPLATGTAQNEDANTVWRELQMQQVSESPRGKLVIAQSSGHLIQLDQPAKVIAAIEGVLAQVKR